MSPGDLQRRNYILIYKNLNNEIESKDDKLKHITQCEYDYALDVGIDKDFFRNSFFENINFRYLGIVDYPDFENSLIYNCTFNSINLSKANFSNATINLCNFKACTIENSIFKGCEILNTNFSKSKLKNLNLENSLLKNTQFISSELNKIDFKYACLDDIHIKNIKKSSIKNLDTVEFYLGDDKSLKLGNYILKIYSTLNTTI
jgi:uncharacterized protein YjbI with pentapeptide repeats